MGSPCGEESLRESHWIHCTLCDSYEPIISMTTIQIKQKHIEVCARCVEKISSYSKTGRGIFQPEQEKKNFEYTTLLEENRRLSKKIQALRNIL